MSMNRIFLYVENNSFGFSRLQIFFEDNKTKYNITNNNRTDTIIIRVDLYRPIFRRRTRKPLGIEWRTSARGLQPVLFRLAHKT